MKGIKGWILGSFTENIGFKVKQYYVAVSSIILLSVRHMLTVVR